ncbi:MAG TPA: response regulator transcription factor [Ginsengibacter sp.]
MQTPNVEAIRVIITDDHVLYRAGVKASLSFTDRIKIIGEAENGSCLLTLLQNCLPDVILLDVQMPVMDGITTLPELKKCYPQIKVIILSMMDDQSMITRLMELGANSYLTKTSDPEIIYEAIQTCHEHEYVYNALTARSLHNPSSNKHLN